MEKSFSINNSLFFSLHDKEITGIEINNNTIRLMFDEGIYIKENNNFTTTNFAEIKIENLDWDFTNFYILKNNVKNKINNDNLLNLISEATIEVINEYYGFNSAKYICNLIYENDFAVLEMTFYFNNPLKVIY